MSNMDTQPRIGRPYSVLTPEQAAALWAEYQNTPFNISARARELNVKPSTLAYHTRGGASAAILRGHWRAAAKVAFQAFRSGDKTKAAEWFREAANRIEKTITTP
jgi:hypothetical protein